MYECIKTILKPAHGAIICPNLRILYSITFSKNVFDLNNVKI